MSQRLEGKVGIVVGALLVPAVSLGPVFDTSRLNDSPWRRGRLLVDEEDRTLLADDKLLLPERYAVANAVGAATAPISGAVDRIVSLEGASRQEIIARAVSDAVAQAVVASADSTPVQIVSTDDVPLAYLPGNMTRVRVKAIGELTAEAVYGR